MKSPDINTHFSPSEEAILFTGPSEFKNLIDDYPMDHLKQSLDYHQTMRTRSMRATILGTTLVLAAAVSYGTTPREEVLRVVQCLGMGGGAAIGFAGVYAWSAFHDGIMALTSKIHSSRI